MNDEERARTFWASIKETCAAQLLEHPEANQQDADRLVARCIAAALAAERERCAVIAERREGISGMIIAKAIRALGDSDD